MKKVILLIAVSFQLITAFGQTSEWGPWVKISCFQGLEAACKNLGYVKSINSYAWNVRIKNNYSKKAHVSFYYSIGGEKIDVGLVSIEPGGIYTHTSLYVKNNSRNYIVTVNDVCFAKSWGGCGNNSAYEMCFAECDNGSPKIPTDCGAGKTNSNNNSSTGNSTNSNTSNTSNNSNSSSSLSTSDLINRWNELCKKADNSQNPAVMSAKARSCLTTARNYEDNAATRNMVTGYIRDLETAFKSDNTNSNSTTQPPQNDLTEYYRSKADLERQMQQQQQEIANRNAEAQRQQQLLKQQQEEQRQKQLQQGINQVTTATVDLITYFKTRKNALRNSLSSEDGQALIDIANSENPTIYVQNIIQIFTDLGYTHRQTETKDGITMITLNNDVANINDFMMISIHPAKYDYYNRISFSYYREKKLKEQLAVLGNSLGGSDGLELKGISLSNNQRKIVEDEKKLDDKTKRVTRLIEDFENNNYWNSLKPEVFSYAKEIAEAYEDKAALNDKSEAIRYYRKAASFPLETLTLSWNGDKSMAAYEQKELGNVFFRLAYLLDIENINGQEAIEWYIKSSIAFKTVHYFNIALIYRFGKGGVAKDWNLAKEYCEKASNGDNADAMYCLGKLYQTGGPNLEKDDRESKKWYKKACKEDKKYCKN